MMTESSFTAALHLSHHSPSYHLRHLMFLIMRLGWISPRRSALLGLEHLDQYQAGFTSQFEHLVQRIEHLESCQESQHEEMMAYLRSMFPSPPQP
ncbi:hypothetical protein AAG906_014823 [Vitis piasezkii]